MEIRSNDSAGRGGMIQQLPHRFPGTAGDMKRLADLLRLGLRTAGWVPPAQPLAVLNLACGRADESGVLAEVFIPPGIAWYLGLDLRDDTLAEAASRWLLPGGIIQFRTADASLAHVFGGLPTLDLAIVRHQNYWHDAARWERMLGNALAALGPGGIIICTSYFDLEHRLMLSAMQDLGAVLAANLPHPASRPLDATPGKSVDRHLAIFRAGRGTLAPEKQAPLH